MAPTRSHMPILAVAMLLRAEFRAGCSRQLERTSIPNIGNTVTGELAGFENNFNNVRRTTYYCIVVVEAGTLKYSTCIVE